MSRRSLLVVAALILVLAGWWIAFAPAPTVGSGTAEARVEAAAVTRIVRGAEQPGPVAAPDLATVPKAKRTVDAAERERVLRGIREALDRRAAAARDRGADPSVDREAAPAVDDLPPPGEGVRDRSGGQLGDLVQAINEDLLPLADECYEQAFAEHSDLGDMADLQFSILGDEELGGVVESLELGPENEIDDPGFAECLRETLFSTVFPAPQGSGQRDVRLTLRFGPPGE